ncbi:MAG: hypothetical protein WCP58_06845 [bacterium]
MRQYIPLCHDLPPWDFWMGVLEIGRNVMSRFSDDFDCPLNS